MTLFIQISICILAYGLVVVLIASHETIKSNMSKDKVQYRFN